MDFVLEYWMAEAMASENEQNAFSSDPDFCRLCGSILPIIGSITNCCYLCKAPLESTEIKEVKYIVHFNDSNVYTRDRDILAKAKRGGLRKGAPEISEGPVVDRDCRQCGNKQMSYATLQLRSADEGQTVFYTCTKCKFKESENS